MKKYLLLLLMSNCFARVPNSSEEIQICIFIFLTGFIFSVIPGAIFKAFKKNSFYNVLIGISLASILFFLAFEAHISIHYSLKVTSALLSGWILSHLLVHIFVFKHYRA